MKKFESEVSIGNASGVAGRSTLPFNRGYHNFGINTNDFGINFTPTEEPNFKTYKSLKHSKKKLKNRKMKKFKNFIKEDADATMGNTGGMGPVVSAQPSSTPGDVNGSIPGSGDIGQVFGTYTKPLFGEQKKRKKKKKKNEMNNLISFIDFNPFKK